MCGRYSLTKKEMRMVSRLPPGELRLFFKERFNIAPTQEAPVILRHEGSVLMEMARWGLQPKWASRPIINAKRESLLEKPAFRVSFEQRRCLVPADGFYEWRKPGKTPFRFIQPDREPFCFAGIWDFSWLKHLDHPVKTFAILTTGANEDVRPYHDRMPLILPAGEWDSWLEDSEAAAALLTRPGPVRLDAFRVSSLVNHAGNDDPRCVAAEEALDI